MIPVKQLRQCILLVDILMCESRHTKKKEMIKLNENPKYNKNNNNNNNNNNNFNSLFIKTKNILY